MSEPATTPAITSAPAAQSEAAPAAAPAQPSAAQSPWFSEFLQQDGSLNHKALDRMPDHLKPLKETWSRAKNFEDIGTMYLNSQHLNGKKALAPLPPDAPANVIAERKQLLDNLNGVPADPKGYGIARPQDFPEQLWSQTAADNLSAWAHKWSVPPAAAKELQASHGKVIQDMAATQAQHEGEFWKAEQSAFEAQIRQEGVSSDKAAALVEKGALKLGLDPQAESTKVFLKGSMARLMAMRHAIATGEDHVVTSNSQSAAAPDPTAAAADIRSNPANPLHGAYWNKGGAFSRSAHDSAVEKHNELLKLAEGKRK